MKQYNAVKTVFRLLLWAGLAAVAGYWLRGLDLRFEWLMVGATIVAVWLTTVLAFLLIGFLIEEDGW